MNSIIKISSSKLILALSVIFFLPSCSGGLQSYSYKAKGVDLKKYKSYAWAKPSDADGEARKDDKQFAPLILQLSNEELEKKGFVLNTEQPDAVFIFDSRVEDRVYL